jgi:hypothetical protein
MKAEWTDNVDKLSCLCCGQPVKEPHPIRSQDHAAATFAVLEALGFTRDSLLNKHRHQIDYQSPGLATWLEDHA